MIYFINTLLFAVIGGTLSLADVNISDWHFWVILGCAVGSNICGFVKGMTKSI